MKTLLTLLAASMLLVAPATGTEQGLGPPFVKPPSCDCKCSYDGPDEDTAIRAAATQAALLAFGMPKCTKRQLKKGCDPFAQLEDNIQLFTFIIKNQ